MLRVFRIELVEPPPSRSRLRQTVELSLTTDANQLTAGRVHATSGDSSGEPPAVKCDVLDTGRRRIGRRRGLRDRAYRTRRANPGVHAGRVVDQIGRAVRG